ncbi:MAG: hypothetical protein KAQ92_06490 [Candidatus Aenigmarchaeota archaeon]|nr:hypothetical protein [Candidatus Aenigmarchaeota archaeon]
MIFLCPKALAGTDCSYEHGFLIDYISASGTKAKVANEVWDAFRFHILSKNSDKTKGERIISNFRGFFEPETIRQKPDFTEINPIFVDEKTTLEKTKDFIMRKGAEIDYFLCQEPEKYQGLKKKPITLHQFLIDRMGDSLETYSRKFAMHKYD